MNELVFINMLYFFISFIGVFMDMRDFYLGILFKKNLYFYEEEGMFRFVQIDLYEMGGKIQDSQLDWILRIRGDRFWEVI